MDTETIDRLFLELSQFTTARTAREMQLRSALERIANEPCNHGPMPFCPREIACAALADDMRPEYDFSQGQRGRYYHEFHHPTDHPASPDNAPRPCPGAHDLEPSGSERRNR